VKRILPFIIVVLVALITAGAGMALYHAKQPAAPVKLTKEKTIENAKTETTHVRGAANAPVTLEEFGDFQCPPCGAIAAPLLEVEKEYGPKLRVVFRNFPFDIHQHARAAAYAAEAAGLQGHFWEMHDLLYREQAAWSKAPDAQQLFESYARVIGLDVELYKKDAESPAVQQRVAADQKRGSELGVKNTPTIFVNNRELPPTLLNPSGVRGAIDEALKTIPAR